MNTIDRFCAVLNLAIFIYIDRPTVVDSTLFISLQSNLCMYACMYKSSLM